MSFFKDIFGVLGDHKKGLLIVFLAVVVVFVIAVLFLSYKTTQSSFCDSCHVMEPYVRHWQASSHAMVECTDCHDYGALDLMVSSFLYTIDDYDSRPKADVPDENCLSSGCHDKESLDPGKEFRKNIVFQHNVHFGTELRGEELRCTSCHNQIVQYDDDVVQHMTVNDKSCFLCHFKDAGMGEAITGCNSCHGMPKKEVEHAGFVFNHEPYLKLKVECKQCHTNVVKGDGSVPQSKCYTCHVERSREQYSREELHKIHVTTEGIDCYKCHSDIQHGNFGMVSALDINCESCHLRQHNKPKQLYMGIGGRDDVDMPSDMFLAQVSCTGCHTHISPEGEIMAEQEKKEANKKSCVNCHGKDYDLMFDNWLEGSKKALTDYKSYLNSTLADFQTIGGSKKSRTTVRKALSEAEESYNFVKEGHMPHNIQYSLFLLNSSAENITDAMKSINKSYKPAKLGSADVENSCVTFCHGKAFQPETVKYKDMELPHQLHITDMGIDCKSCHSVKEHGKTRIDNQVCSDCHDF